MDPKSADSYSSCGTNPNPCLDILPRSPALINEYCQSTHFPELPEELWMEIFRYATYLPNSGTMMAPDPFEPARLVSNIMDTNTPLKSLRTKRSLILVSRFWWRMASQLLYERLTICCRRQTQGLIYSLSNRIRGSNTEKTISEYGQWVRHVEIQTWTRFGHSMQYLQQVASILEHCPKVRYLDVTWEADIPESFVDYVSGLYGNSLKCLRWAKTVDISTTRTPEFLSAFRSLRMLDLTKFMGCPPSLTSEPSSTGLHVPSVEVLILTLERINLTIAAALRLPALHRVIFNCEEWEWWRDDQLSISPFLAAHGHNITELELLSSPQPRASIHIDISIFLRPGLCPNLRDLVFDVREARAIVMTDPHLSLRRIGLRGIRSDFLYSKHAAHVQDHLKLFTPRFFPALEVIRTISYMVDASTDEYARDTFIWWTERFERHGIDFQDGEGVVWQYDEPDGVDCVKAFSQEETPPNTIDKID